MKAIYITSTCILNQITRSDNVNVQWKILFFGNQIARCDNNISNI